MHKRRWIAIGVSLTFLAIGAVILVGAMGRDDVTSHSSVSGVTEGGATDLAPGGLSEASSQVGTVIALETGAIGVSGGGAVVSGSTVTIAAAGSYTIRGTVEDAQIVVDAASTDTVRLILDGANITCLSSAPIYVRNAAETVITLTDGSDNYVSDGGSYVYEDPEIEEPSAAIFSSDDLTIDGSGSLTVTANVSNGIQSKDDLRVTGGILTVFAANDGLKGRDSVTIGDATVTIEASGDGIQSNNDEDPTKGIVTIESGTLEIEAELDGIQAETSLCVNGGDLTLVAGGGSGNSSSAAGMAGNPWGAWGVPGRGSSTAADVTSSAKGLKAGTNLEITDGTIEIDSSDDSIHSNGTMTISGGTIEVASGDDGIHADTSLEIAGGEITITKSYEGIESSEITLSGGTIHVTASDDGINAAGGNDASSLGGRPGQNMFSAWADCHLYIHGGSIYVDAAGDGLDVNGPISMTGGLVVVNGPTESMNGAIDYSGSFTITGGTLVAAGSAGMAQAPSSSSTQSSVMVNLSSMVSAGTLLHIESADGTDVLTFRPSKAYQSIVVSSPDLQSRQTYAIFAGGSASGESTDGVYSNEAYVPGTQLSTFTISSTVTVVGSASGPGGGRGPRFP